MTTKTLAALTVTSEAIGWAMRYDLAIKQPNPKELYLEVYVTDVENSQTDQYALYDLTNYASLKLVTEHPDESPWALEKPEEVQNDVK